MEQEVCFWSCHHRQLNPLKSLHQPWTSLDTRHLYRFSWPNSHPTTKRNSHRFHWLLWEPSGLWQFRWRLEKPSLRKCLRAQWSKAPWPTRSHQAKRTRGTWTSTSGFERTSSFLIHFEFLLAHRCAWSWWQRSERRSVKGHLPVSSRDRLLILQWWSKSNWPGSTKWQMLG